MAGYAEQVLAGQSYFFAWYGPTRATVQLDQDKTKRWKFIEVLGKENQALPSQEFPMLIKELSQRFKDGLFVCQTSIVGTSYYDYQQAAPQLKHHDLLDLNHEKENAYDSQAIEIITQQGLKMGYIPRNKNTTIAQWFTMGIPMKARLIIQHGWHVEVFV